MPGPKMNVKPTAKGTAGRAGAAAGKGGGLKSRLAGFKKNWNEKKESAKKSGFGEDFPGTDGKYLFKLAKCEVRESSAGLFFDFAWECVAGDFTGSMKDYGKNMDDEKQFGWLLRDLTKLGVDVDALEPEQLEDVAKELVTNETHCIGTIVTKGAYQNFNIVRLVEASEIADVTAEYGGAGDGTTATEPETTTEPEPETSVEPTKPKGWKPVKGARVTVQFDGVWYGGEIGSIPPGGKSSIVNFDDGDKKPVPNEAIFPEPEGTAAEEPAAEGEAPKIGDNVWFSDGKDEFTGEVKGAKGTLLTVKLDTGKMKQVDTSKIDVSVLA